MQTERFFYEEEKNNKSDKNEQKFNEVKLESGQFFKFYISFSLLSSTKKIKGIMGIISNDPKIAFGGGRLAPPPPYKKGLSE